MNMVTIFYTLYIDNSKWTLLIVRGKIAIALWYVDDIGIVAAYFIYDRKFIDIHI